MKNVNNIFIIFFNHQYFKYYFQLNTFLTLHGKFLIKPTQKLEREQKNVYELHLTLFKNDTKSPLFSYYKIKNSIRKTHIFHPPNQTNKKRISSLKATELNTFLKKKKVLFESVFHSWKSSCMETKGRKTVKIP